MANENLTFVIVATSQVSKCCLHDNNVKASICKLSSCYIGENMLALVEKL